MSDLDAPEGTRFSFLYIRSDEVLKDSPRMRLRLARVFKRIGTVGHDSGMGFGRFAEAELGVRMIRPGMTFFDFDTVIGTLEISDVLDMVTLLYKFQSTRTRREALVDAVQRVFVETQVGYRVDPRGGVHPHIDEAFEAVRASAIEGLGGNEFEAERQYVEDAERALMADPIEGRQAIRSIFDAVENLFKKMYGVTQLNSAAIQANIQESVQQINQTGNNSAKTSSQKSVRAFREWVDACHPYRHASGEEVPTQPNEEHVVLLVTQGLAYLRWLAKIFELIRSS